VEKLIGNFEIEGDAAQMALRLYQHTKPDLLAVVQESAHAKRLAKFNIVKDIEFCLTIDKYAVIPVLKEGVLEKM